MREILHFQLGNKSNFVGTHLWNILVNCDLTQSLQFENGNQLLDEEVLYRKGEFRETLNYTPRMISVDLKGAKKMGAGLYSEEDVENQQPVYNSPPVKISRSKNLKNKYQKDLELLEDEELDLEEAQKTYSEHLTETTKLWSDFNGCYYHPLTWNEIDSYNHNSATAQFSNFTQGTDVYENQNFGFDLMEDKTRKFMEECDSPQGFQIITDADDAFSGFTHSLVQELGQEYAKKTVMIYSLSQSSSVQTLLGKLNQSLLLKSVEEEDAVYIPIKLPSQSDLNSDTWSKNLSPRFDTLYQSSGFIAAAIDNVSLTFKLSNVGNRMDMHQLQQIIEYQSSSTCSLSLGFPPLRPHMKSSEISGIFGPELSWSRNLTLETDGPAFAATGKSFNVVSGITECAKLASTRELRDDIQSRLDINPACKSHLLIHDSAFRIPAPFPQFFSKNVTAEGLISTTLQDGYVEKVPVVTRLNSGESINVLYEDAVKLLKASTKYGSTIPGFEREEINEITEYFDSKLEI